MLTGKALYEGGERPVYVRVAQDDEAVYLDLANERHEVVKITAAGWAVTRASQIRFRRPAGMLALPTPERGGTIQELRPHVNVTSDKDFVLVVAWLLNTLQGRWPYPLLVESGEQGSAKSTTARVLCDLIDPNAVPLRAEPREIRDLMIATKGRWVQAYDNLSKLDAWLSDALCRLSTGGGFATRGLYTNDEETVFSARCPVLLNGIEDLTTRSDLLERSLLIDLPAIPEDRRKPENEFWDGFMAARPRILGSLLDGVAAALKNLPTTHLERLPRMADFARWTTAAEPALGWAPGTFIDAYNSKRQDASTVALDASLVAQAVQALVTKGQEGRVAVAGWEDGQWTGTAGELLTALASHVPGGNTEFNRAWPKDGARLSGELRRLAPDLRRAGVDVQLDTRAADRSRRRLVVLRPANGMPVARNAAASGGNATGEASVHTFPDGADAGTLGTLFPPTLSTAQRVL